MPLTSIFAVATLPPCPMIRCEIVFEAFQNPPSPTGVFAFNSPCWKSRGPHERVLRPFGEESRRTAMQRILVNH